MRRHLACLIALAGLSAAARADESPAYRIKDRDDRKAVEVHGLNAANLTALGAAKWDATRWQGLFAVHVGKDRARALKAPPVFGTYSVKGDVLLFEPRFPFADGTSYTVVFRPARLPQPPAGDPKSVAFAFSYPRPERTAPTVVAQVYPTRDRLPENQLKFYIHFSAPMKRGGVYDHIKLLDENGKEVAWPFLELDEELWNVAGTRFTLFFDPGRIKRGLKPREEVGPALEEGKKYTLVIDKNWRDADDYPLKETYRKRFSVGAPDDTCPDPKRWKLDAPAAGTTKPLVVRFEEPLDHALLHRIVWVEDAAGRRVEGTVKVTDRETRWHFTPKEPWRAGAYQLVADTVLEDLAGNSIGKPFEVDVLRPVERTVKQQMARVPFEVTSR